MANRSAHSVLFGFDFQTNAAIVLMLENIKNMYSIRLEGAEDIEINLNDGSCILVPKTEHIRSKCTKTPKNSQKNGTFPFTTL